MIGYIEVSFNAGWTVVVYKKITIKYIKKHLYSKNSIRYFTVLFDVILNGLKYYFFMKYMQTETCYAHHKITSADTILETSN